MRLTLIVSIHNISRYFKETISSIKNQSLQDMEILCIHDCSDNNSWSMLQEAAAQDSRIRLLCQEKNTQLGSPIKKAILESSGRYIMFLNSDDSLEVNACQDLVTLMDEKMVDILHFGTTLKSESNISIEEEQGFYNFSKPYNGSLRRDDLYNACFHEHLFDFSLWNKIYRGEVVRNAFKKFPDIRLYIAQDILTFFAITCFSKTYSSCVRNYYIRRRGNVHIAKSKMTFEEIQKSICQKNVSSDLSDIVSQFLSYDEKGKIQKSLFEFFLDRIILWCIFETTSSQSIEIINNILGTCDQEDILSSLMRCAYNWQIDEQLIIKCIKPSNLIPFHKKNVKTIASYYIRAYDGGTERVMAGLAQAWCNMGLNVIIITDEPQNATDYKYPQGVTRICLNTLLPKSINTPINRAKILYRIIKKYHVDLIVNHAWCCRTLFWDTVAFKMANTAVLIHTHNSLSTGYSSYDISWWIHTTKLGFFYELTDGIITLTNTETAWWNLWHPFVFHTVNPVSLNYDETFEKRSVGHHLLWIGRIAPEKQPFYALQIFKEVIDKIPDAILHIVGKSDDDAYYQDFLDSINQLNLTSFVVLHGFQQDVESFYEKCDIYLCTSAYEGFCLTMAESKTKGLPCVTFDIKNLDMIQERQGMFVVPQGDIQGASNAIIKLLLDPILWSEMSKQAHESAKPIALFDQKKMWSEIISHVESAQKSVFTDNTAVKMHANDILRCFNQINKENQNLSDQLNELHKWVQMLDDGKKYLESQVQIKDKKLEETENTIDKYKQWTTELDEGKKFLFDKAAKTEEYCNELKKQLDEQKQWTEELQNGNNYLKRQIQDSTSYAHALEEELLKQKQWTEECLNAKHYFETKTQEAEQAYQNLKNWTDQLQSDKTSIENQCNFYKELADSQKRELEQCRDDIHTYSNTVAKLQYKLNRLTSDSLIQKIIKLRGYEV